MNSRVRLLAALFAMPLNVLAGTSAFQETASIPSPDESYAWPVSVAIDGDWLIATGEKNEDVATGTVVDSSAWLYRRQSNGRWTLVRRLLQSIAPTDFDEPLMNVDMQGSVAVLQKEHATWIFERSGSEWMSVPSPIETDGMDVEVSDGVVAVTAGTCDWITNSYRKNSSGAWVRVRTTAAESSPECENEDDRGDVDVSENAVIVATYASETSTPSARIFEGPFGTTAVMTRLLAPEGAFQVGFGGAVALDLPAAVVRHAIPDIGPQAFTRNSSGQWINTGSVQRPDDFRQIRAEQIELRDGLAIFSHPNDDLYGEASGSIAVFQRHDDGAFSYVAKLLPSDVGAFHFFGLTAEIGSGRRVVAASREHKTAYVFELPADLTQPTTMQDDFQDGNAADWTPQAGSLYSVATTTSRVYGQRSTAGNATSLWNNTSRANQAIEADIKPTAFSSTSGDKWFGLVARYQDATNNYYVTLRNNNTLLLRKMINGVFSTLDSAPLTIALNRTYRVRLEAIGTHLRVHVNGRLLAEATDSALTQGQAGVVTFRARADYDNVLVDSNPLTPLATYQFGPAFGADSYDGWESVGTWSTAEGVYRQTDTSTRGAHSITGIATGDQVVSARLRRTGAAGSNNWLGLAARYRDAGNYYYVTLRNNNTISLRKLVNGVVAVLDSAAFNVTTNTWYRVRLEAVGTHLRVYVNDVLRLEATDAAHATGRYGPVLYRTVAEYDSVTAVEP